MIKLGIIIFLSFTLGYFIGCALCHRNARRRKSGYLRYEVPNEVKDNLGRKVRVIDKATGKVKYEGTVSPIHKMCDATEITLKSGGSRIYYWMDNTESMEYID